jgi:chaperone modulatory protein CbpM
MSNSPRAALHPVLVEQDLEFTLLELSSVCRIDSAQLIALVEEGVLLPSGDAPEHWRFAGTALRRARVAARLTRDLEMSAAVAALVLDLLDEIEMLRSEQWRRAER